MPSSTADQGRAVGESDTDGQVHIVARWARTGIEAIAVGAGVAALPVSVPLLVAAKVLAGRGRVIAATMTDGAVPLVGPPIARTLDRIQGYATPERSPGAAA